MDVHGNFNPPSDHPWTTEAGGTVIRTLAAILPSMMQIGERPRVQGGED